jgi:PAS domain S-box-containing protein
MTLCPGKSEHITSSQGRDLTKYAADLLVIGVAYVALAKAGLLLASVHPSATPIWPPTGLALSAVLVRGLRTWPAIFLGALIANATTDLGNATATGWVLTSSAIAAGNTLEAVVGGCLITVWSGGGRKTFDTPSGVTKFALIALGPSTMISATVGLGSLSLAGYAELPNFATIWLTWWLGDVAGALVFTPVVVLWITGGFRPFNLDKFLDSSLAQLGAGVIGLVALSPLIEPTVGRSSLSFLAVLPLLWAALRCGPRDTATVALILSCFAVWATQAGRGPFGGLTRNESFLLLIMFMISVAVPSLVLSVDVALRKRVEARLRQQQQILGAMFSQAVVGIAQLDMTGRFKLVNDQFCEIVQRPSAELLQLRIQDITDPEDVSHMLDLFGQVIHQGDGFAIETRYVLPDRSGVWVRNNISAIFDQDGMVRCFVAVAEDVTARRRAEEKLRGAHADLRRLVHERTAALNEANNILLAEIEQRKCVEDALKHDIAERRKTQEALTESERRFRLLIQGVTDYAIFMLDPDGYIINWNMGARRIHQYAAAEIIGQHFSRFYTEEEQQRGEPVRALQLAAYEGKYVADGWRVRRDESLFWANVVVEAIRDERGTLVGYAKITRDITERRDAQLALTRAQEQLTQSQKMEALGQLTGSIAHDFNNLLMIVSGHAQILRRRLSDPRHLQSVEAVNSAVSRGESLTRQLLAFSRRQPLSPIVVDLKERIDAVHEMLVGSLRGNIELRCDIPAGIWPVEIDVAELELALVNIAVNARDAMSGGGTITLSALNVALKKSDEIEQLEGDFVALTMNDTGVGIRPDVLPRIFEPFFSTKPLGKGTGLGLSQVYGFAHQSGGSVIVKSTVGSGTSITLYLRRSQRAPVTKSARPSAAQPVVARQGTVLVVEDNTEVANVTATLVEQLGYRTLRAESATDALNQLQGGDKISLVLSDIAMPGGMNGIALAQEIHHRYPEIPVLLNSAYSDMVQAVDSRFTILRKPFQLPALEKSIRETLERVGDQDKGGRVLQISHWRPSDERHAQAVK